MIMNHKEAILFLVENAQEIEIDSRIIRTLYHLLSQDLLPGPKSCVRDRWRFRNVVLMRHAARKFFPASKKRCCKWQGGGYLVPQLESMH